MNRVGLGLAVGAGYVLGRTKKMKLAFAVGTLVAGKRMQLSPRALADLVSGQLRDNPQFKEIGDQLREDLRGVGKAASGAMVERQLDALADRLHGRTAQVRDQLAGALPDGSDLGFEKDEADDDNDRETDEYDEDEAYDESGDEPEAEREESEPPRKKAAAKKAPAKKTAAKKAPAKKSAARAPAKKATAGAKKTTGRTAAKKTAAARSTARGARSRVSKGGGDR
ncbi:DNA primase [Streptomyces aquilus]|uniref:DNA primase n=1 Tax=Streptomyces aquilus TaxID=2548456 RepID=A0A3Q9C7M8_9ACTN|nr:DNA primase [Streptomyces aquilus]AZP21367.1 DNA primase [Streptomyces aquilus]